MSISLTLLSIIEILKPCLLHKMLQNISILYVTNYHENNHYKHYQNSHNHHQNHQNYNNKLSWKFTLASLLHSHLRTSARFLVFSWQILVIIRMIIMIIIIVFVIRLWSLFRLLLWSWSWLSSPHSDIRYLYNDDDDHHEILIKV